MKYIDRKGNMTIEENSQDRFLKFLYESRPGRWCLPVLVRPWVTELGGWFFNTSLSARLIPGFAERNRIDMGQYQEEVYGSYNDFFTRKIRPEARPINQKEKCLISPCDGKLSVYRIGRDSRLEIKGQSYTVESLLRNRKLACRYEGGYAFVFRLTVDNYHRYCYPAEGVKSSNVFLRGVYHTVNPAAAERRPIYSENAREYTLLQTPRFGTLVQMEVGAMMVGKITNYHKAPRKVDRGEEKGRFEFGGSTVILLAQYGKVRPDADLLENTENGFETVIRMGERIGEYQLSKRTGKNYRRSGEERKNPQTLSS